MTRPGEGPRALLLLCALLGPAGCAAEREGTMHQGDDEHGDHHHHHGHRDAAGWAEVLDDPGRDAWQRPGEVVAAMTLREGMVVADLGAGTGYFEPHLGPAVGARGRVLALDIDPELIEHMRRRFEAAGLTNVEARRIEPTDPGLEPRSVDRVLVVDTWHHLSDRVTYAKKLREALAPGGQVVVVDYTKEAPEGPPPELRLEADVVLSELRAAGLVARLVQDEALPRQYVVIAERP